MPEIILPYGDTLDDGKVQLSFTLPVPESPRAREAAKRIILGWGFSDCEVVHAAPISDGFTFFVAYARTARGIDWSEVRADIVSEEAALSMDEVDAFIRQKFGRKIVVVGACIGFDAHTVGIDAIMNMKGYNHHYGLERYAMVEAHNLGAQVPASRLIEAARNFGADAILVSQVVTQKDVHIATMVELIELLEAADERGAYLCVAGGPRITNAFALELGYDAGFGRGTYAEDVASFIVRRLAERAEAGS